MSKAGKTTEARLAKFHAMANHLWLARLYGKLTKAEIRACEEFIAARDGLDRDQFASAVNRWFIGASDRPKHHLEMAELVSGCDS